jgi:hypothetical protein
MFGKASGTSAWCGADFGKALYRRKTKGGDVLTALMKPFSSMNLDRLFLPALVTQPHHAADLAGCGHHLCRLHRFAAALRHIEINDSLLGGCFCGFAHFCHGNVTSVDIGKTRAF